MNKSELLNQLRDIHMPSTVSWWPLAFGWYILFFLCIGLSAFLIYYFYQRYQQKRVQRFALCLLKSYQQQYEQSGNSALACAQVSALLKRVALAYFPRETVSALQGTAWLEFLQNTSKNIFFTEISALLVELPYQQHAEDVDLQPLFSSAQHWIIQRRRPC